MNNYKTGKILLIKKEEGIGYVVDGEKEYLFKLNDTNTDFTNLEKEDLVRFRAELVNNIDRAFFVKKVLKNEKTNQN